MRDYNLVASSTPYIIHRSVGLCFFQNTRLTADFIKRVLYRLDYGGGKMDQPMRQHSAEGALQLRTAPNDLIPQASPTHSLSSLEDQSPGRSAPPRRSSLPNNRSDRTSPENIDTKQSVTRNTKSLSAGVRERSSFASLMTMTGTMSAAHEITYTPTTHRVSKAKKGKKVHACEYPGCSKVASPYAFPFHVLNLIDLYPGRASQVSIKDV